MCTTPDTAVRELDHRRSDGIDVRLLWDSRTNHVTVAVEDSRSEVSFELPVEAADALDAFYHPFAYVRRDHGADRRRAPKREDTGDRQ
jgi:hypothetical protein